MIQTLLQVNYYGFARLALDAAMATIGGLIVWTLTEYFTHRFLNHPSPSRKWLDWDNHLYHHHAPNDPREFVYKLRFSLKGSAVILAAWCLIAPTWTHGVAIMGGFWIGYLSYEWVHLFAHLPTRYRTSWMKQLSALHHRHHYEGVRGCYGFVSSIWDRLFRTYS